MRKVLLVIGLIGASFAGGAVVNGPGLDLLRAVLRGEPSGEPDPVLPMAGAGVGAAGLAPFDPSEDPFPAAPGPVLSQDDPLVPEALPPRSLETVLAHGPGDNPEVQPLEPLPDPAASLESLGERSEDADPAAASPEPAEVLAPPPPTTEPLPRLEPTPPLTASASDLAAPTGTDEAPIPPPLPPRADPDVSQASQQVVTTESAETDGDVDAESAPASGEWSVLRNRLAEAGVTRYWIEGTPDGRVRFRCVIPLAGETAVSRQFEAEGDDEPAAAELVLRRIALWNVARNAGSP